MKRQLVFGTQTFSYELTRKLVKRINARVDRMGNIHVSAPSSVKAEAIDRFILDNAEKLLSAADRQKAAFQKAPRVRDGEEILLLGRKKRLHIVFEGERGVCERETAVVIAIGRGEGEREATRLLSAYLEKRAVAILSRLFDECYQAHFAHSFPKPILRFRRMRGAWGNCRRERGLITLNLRLIYAPEGAIEYVILHELAHMMHPDHSPRFWATVGEYMKDYSARRALLRDVPIAFDSFL